MTRHTSLLAAALAALAASAFSSPAQQHQHGASPAEHAHPSAGARAPDLVLLDGLGSWSQRITTRSPLAQRWFDQGLRLAYAFNHDEAARSFERAARIDPSCAMCWWGVAYAVGPNINLPVDTASERRGAAAVREARARLGGVTAREKAYIEAIALRVAEPVGAQRATRDSAYARAMREVARRFPQDADAQVLYGDALLNLRPWNQWTRDGRPQPGTLDAVAALERVVRAEPTHAGACHLYVHAVEASSSPARALACAERLPRLMPAAGHVVHMPAHIYLRLGRYADAARANVAAVEADRRYFDARDVPAGMYPMFYAPHNLHFLWTAHLLAGNRAEALKAARSLVARVSPAEARSVAALEGFLPSLLLTHLRFGDWNAVLREPVPDPALGYTRGMWHFARGMARAARGERALARTELDSLRARARAASPSTIIILNSAPALLGLATEVLTAEIARREGRHDAAIWQLRAAVKLEDALSYDEPPPWYHSTRNLLGQALLDAGRAREAAAAFRDDLRVLPNNAWSVAGVRKAGTRD
jgi:tetratricopeptide (TPR) repeat protein